MSGHQASQKTVHDLAVFKMYLKHLRPYPWLVFFTIILGIVFQVTELLAPILLRQLFNTVATTTPGNAGVVHQLVVLLGILICVWLSGLAVVRTQYFMLMHLQTGVMKNLFASAFDHLMGHSYSFFVSRFAGSLTHKVSKFSRAFEVMFDSIILEFFPTFLFVAGAVGVLFTRHHTLGIALGLWAIAFTLFQVYVARLRFPIRVAAAAADTKVTATLADAISNHVNVSLFSGIKTENSIFGGVVDSWRAKIMRIWSVDQTIWTFIGIFMVVIQAGLLYGAIIYWDRGLLEIGDFVLIQSYLLVTFARLTSINRTLRRFYDALADSKEMAVILDEPHEIRDVANALPITVSRGTIDFKDVTFHFQEERSILEHLDLTIRPGEKVALVGPSGAGKSTITKLLLRMYDVTEGAIEIDGQNISKVTQDSLRDAIGFVPQEPVLFHRSLMENIRYGKRDASDEEVIEAAKKAHCHEFIQGLALGYDTYVGERGVKLSGGERQRVAIARAILKDAPILVLDEATSSLDSESESLIQDSLKVLMQGKTVLVIAHRLSTIMNMDRIVVLQGGKVVADGTHDELLKEGGLYQKLWSIQAGGFIKDEEE